MIDMEGDYVKTGIPGIDSLLGEQGIPRGYVVFVNGAPGSGKTTFAIQFLYKGATQFDEPGVYVSLDESPTHITRNMKSFGWDLEKLEDENKLVMLDSSPIRRIKREIKVKREFSMERLIDTVGEVISKIGAKRVAIDPLAILTIQYPSTLDRVYAVMDLLQALAETQCTTLMISELKTSAMEREYQLEEYLAQGTILLRTFEKPGGLIRAFQIEKLRGIKHDPQPRPYKITGEGIEVYPEERVL